MKTNYLFFRVSLFDTAAQCLGVVRGRDSINAVAPNVRAQLGQRESRVVRDDALAQLRTWLAGLAILGGASTKVEIANRCTDFLGQSFTLCRGRLLEVGLEVHLATNRSGVVARIDQNDLLSKRNREPGQIFLHVDQND